MTAFGEDPAQHRRAEHRDDRRSTAALRETTPRDNDDEEHRIDAQCRFDAREVMKLVGACEQRDGAEDHQPPERARMQPPGQRVGNGAEQHGDDARRAQRVEVDQM